MSVLRCWAPVPQRLCPTDQDSVRLLAVESCGSFATALGREEAAAQLLPVVQKFAQVRSATGHARRRAGRRHLVAVEGGGLGEAPL